MGPGGSGNGRPSKRPVRENAESPPRVPPKRPRGSIQDQLPLPRPKPPPVQATPSAPASLPGWEVTSDPSSGVCLGHALIISKLEHIAALLQAVISQRAARQPAPAAQQPTPATPTTPGIPPGVLPGGYSVNVLAGSSGDRWCAWCGSLRASGNRPCDRCGH